MAVSIFVIASDSGVPLFSRKSTNKESLQFASIASLHGIKMFCNHHDTTLLNTQTANGCIEWQQTKRLTLIGLSNCIVYNLQKLLTAAYNAMILIIGGKNLEELYSMEQIKRELRNCYTIVDLLLQTFEASVSRANSMFSLNLIESMLLMQAPQLQNVLELYAKRTSGRWASLIVHGRVAAVSQDWSTLHPAEAHLLILVAVQNGAPLREQLVYLPFTSPDVPFRAIVCKLLSDVFVLVVCGPNPSLMQIDEIVLHCWERSTPILNEAKLCFPRNFPQDMQFEIGVLNVLIVDISTKRCFISRNPQGNAQQSEDNQSAAHRLDILKSFYLKAAEELTLDVSNDKNEYVLLKRETYWCLEYHKCHAKIQDGVLCCALYACNVPIHTMRIITSQIITKFNSLFDQVAV